MIKKRQLVIKAWGVSHLGASRARAVMALLASSELLATRAEGHIEQDGQALFQKRCTGCHALDADHEGPRLRGVVGRAAGTVKTFQYSEALKNAKHTWDEANLNKWLTDQESVVPDNDMSFQVHRQK